MKSRKAFVIGVFGLLLFFLPIAAYGFTTREGTARDTGFSAWWIFANISYAGMRAQASQSVGWRIVAFIFGFPGTLLSLLVIKEGSERMYGIDIPRRNP